MMINGLIAATEIGLIVLLGVLALRMYLLARNELQAGPVASQSAIGLSGFIGGAGIPRKRKPEEKPAEPATSDRTLLLSHLHILAGLQERDCRVNGLVLAEAPAAVRAYASVWLYGASCALSHKSFRHSEALEALVARTISRKAGIQQSEAIQAISTLTSSSILLACYRAGLEGAEYWSVHHFVPSGCSLHDVITSNAFV